MTNDILEQVAEDYLRSRGYFTQHNIKYRPSVNEARYRVNSDIDILGYHPTRLKNDLSKVIVANCKSWQSGLNISWFLRILENTPNRKAAGKEAWKHFREIFDKVWAQALRKKVKELTGADCFTFYLIVTKFQGDKVAWETSKLFLPNLLGCDLRILSMGEMIHSLQSELTITPAHSALTRMLQLIKAGGGKVTYGQRKI